MTSSCRWIAIIGLLASQNLWGAAAPAAKYGVLDMQSVILNVAEGKKARAALEKEIKAKEAEAKKRQVELEQMNKELVQNAAVLSDEAKLKKQQAMQEKLLGYRNEEMTFKADIKRKEQKATQKIAVKVATIVEKMAQERGLEVVFESNSAGLLFLKDPVDLTGDVIKAYDAAPSDGAGAKKKISEPITSAQK